MSFELNKIFGAVVLALLVGMLSAFAADLVVEPEQLEKPAYVVAVADDSAGTAQAAAAPTGPEPVATLLASADVAKGQALTKACAACHNFEKGGPNKVGPNLWGIVNNVHAHAEGFAYSEAMKAKHGDKWDYEALNAFLYKPKAAVPGTKMAYAGLSKTEDRANLIAYLRPLSDSPAPLP